MRTKKIIIYSPCNIVGNAIKHLCLNGVKHTTFSVDGFEIETLRRIILAVNVSYIVLDVNPVEYSYELYCIRSTFPEIPVIIIQRDFYVLDKIIAQFFGGMWLIEYDAALAVLPSKNLMDFVSDDLFAYANMTLPLYKESLIDSLKKWIDIRLAAFISSARDREVLYCMVFNRLSVKEIAEKLKVSNQIIYLCRKRVINSIGYNPFRLYGLKASIDD